MTRLMGQNPDKGRRLVGLEFEGYKGNKEAQRRALGKLLHSSDLEAFALGKIILL